MFTIISINGCKCYNVYHNHTSYLRLLISTKDKVKLRLMEMFLTYFNDDLMMTLMSLINKFITIHFNGNMSIFAKFYNNNKKSTIIYIYIYIHIYIYLTLNLNGELT